MESEKGLKVSMQQASAAVAAAVATVVAAAFLQEQIAHKNTLHSRSCESFHIRSYTERK